MFHASPMASADSPPSDSSATTMRFQGVFRTRPRRIVRVVYSPDRELEGRVFALDGSTYEWGRQVQGSGRADDRHMSRRHFRLVPRDDDYVVVDLGAANGTFMNGAPVSESALLTAGAVVSAGQTLFVEETEPSADALPAAPGADGDSVSEVVGVSLVAERLRQAIATVARSSGSVLILGETGTGKEVTAQAIHRLSGRPGPIVPVNCAAIPPNLAEAELFGYRKGAFTGADEDREGYFAQADGGTLFLDEVGDLAAAMQAKLLRVLEDQKVHPVGGGRPTKVDVRVLGATLIDLEDGDFRRDLLARLGSWVLKLPRLAERRSDVLPLWRHFMKRETGGGPRPMSAAFAAELVLHDWPLNVRELGTIVHRVHELVPAGATLDLEHLPIQFRDKAEARTRLGTSRAAPAAADVDSPETIDGAPAREELLTHVRAARGNVKQIAINGGWHRTQVYRWLKRYGIDLDAYR